MHFSASRRSTGEEDRKPSVAGSFYPASESELKRELSSLLEMQRVEQSGRVRAIIVPHAGYVYSGSVAAAAYKSIRKPEAYDNIFIIGTSHREQFRGAALYGSGSFLTPLGKVEVNKEITNSLIERCDLLIPYPGVHKAEHSIEVQLPFIQQVFGTDIKIIPILIGTEKKSDCQKIANTLKSWFTEKNLFVISSDFSHYPSYSEANTLDMEMAEALMSGSIVKFCGELSKSKKDHINLITRMCAWSAALTLLYVIEGDDNLRFNHISYLNSGDSKIGDHKRVVGYHAISLIRPEENQPGARGKGKSSDLILSKEEKLILLDLAKDSIESYLHKKNIKNGPEFKKGAGPMMHLGAFVTIYKGGKLRGCIGRFMPSQALWEVVREVARAAAFNDSRFDPVSKRDLESIVIEISVLTPLRRVKNIEEIEPGRHGVYIKRGTSSGTYLPKVSEGMNWSVEELLGRVSRDKAGIEFNGWRTSEIYVYEAITFNTK